MYVLNANQRRADSLRRRRRLLRLLKLRRSKRVSRSFRIPVGSNFFSHSLSLPLIDAISSVISAKSVGRSVPGSVSNSKSVKRPLADHQVPGVHTPVKLSKSDKDFATSRMVFHIWNGGEQKDFRQRSRILTGDGPEWLGRIGSAFTHRQYDSVKVPYMTVNGVKDVFLGSAEADHYLQQLEHFVPMNGLNPGYYFLDRLGNGNVVFKGYSQNFQDIPWKVAASVGLVPNVQGGHSQLIDAETGYVIEPSLADDHKVFSIGSYAPPIDQGRMDEQLPSVSVFYNKNDYNNYKWYELGDDHAQHNIKMDEHMTTHQQPVYRHHVGFRDKDDL